MKVHRKFQQKLHSSLSTFYANLPTKERPKIIMKERHRLLQLKPTMELYLLPFSVNVNSTLSIFAMENVESHLGSRGKYYNLHVS